MILIFPSAEHGKSIGERSPANLIVNDDLTVEEGVKPGDAVYVGINCKIWGRDRLLKLINFRLVDSPVIISIEADGNVYDLHGRFDFSEVRQKIEERSISMVWQTNTYFDSLKPIEELELLFTNVDYFVILPRDNETPDFGEDLCLDAVAYAMIDEDLQLIVREGRPCYRYDLGENFHLWFVFSGGQHIRIGTETATFSRRVVG